MRQKERKREEKKKERDKPVGGDGSLSRTVSIATIVGVEKRCLYDHPITIAAEDLLTNAQYCEITYERIPSHRMCRFALQELRLPGRQ